MSDILDFSYSTSSRLIKKPSFQELVLSHHTEIEELANIPCFFWGEMKAPVLTAKALLCLSKVVRSSFAPIPVRLLDPIITAGQNELRFEGFSSCNGVYARLDILSDAMDGEFIAHGTTNVDFNEPMINALNAVKKSELMMIGVGDKEVNISTKQGNVQEKKVKLPDRWIKGLTSVQVYLSEMDEIFRLNKLQVMQFFASLPKSKNTNMYLLMRANRVMFTPIYSANSIKIGGIERLRLLEMLLPYIEEMVFFQNEQSESMAVQLYMNNMRFTFALSPENNRGFSGEGNILEKMTAELPTEYIYAFNHLLKSNETFNPTLLSIEHQIDFNSTESLTATLSAMGLLGFDLYQRQYYYRRLPFKMEKILSLNPRLKNAKKLISDENIHIISRTHDEVVAKVKGTDVEHTVVIRGNESKCTCQWYAKHQNQRGLCKHILAVKLVQHP
ncbi:SWIM zinc finger family protein [Moraxella sp. ZY210820]|uniref:SWIM zinc finger family protein n=1 Tax=unclassified Moraxella TaxID=2685852 RepID=UPI002730DF48|nr:SWIM zinc finger family protein [Moraxella sp. ZY210820]WLF83742.1 SWIM zinc finger family protein [Moraxella sp. ZY210820]